MLARNEVENQAKTRPAASMGEGTGALLLLSLLDAAAEMTCRMATLDSLGIAAKGKP